MHNHLTDSITQSCIGHKKANPLAQNVVFELQQRVRNQKVKVRELIASYDVRQRACVQARGLQANPSSKKFWEFVRGNARASNKISAAYDESGNITFEPTKIQESVKQTWSRVFAGKDSLPNPPETSSPTLEQESEEVTSNEKFVCRPFTKGSLRRALAKLKTGKARGVDGIPAEILKFAGPVLQEYLLTFYNKIFRFGHVPSLLNLSKLILLDKVTNVCITQ